jgi:hypothetical protein
MAVEKFENNIAHSMGRFGLRVFILTSLKNPCGKSRGWDDADPWTANPSSLNLFKNFEAYKCNECGLLSEYVGHT